MNNMTTETLKVVRRTYFPTSVFQIDLPNPEPLNEHLLETIYQEQEADSEGISRSNIKELGGWHSHNNLFKEKNYAGLVSKINQATSQMSADMGYDERKKLSIGTMWSIINPPGASNRAHVHPGCLWSGVYYIQAPKDAGRIEFVEPRTQHLMNQPAFKPNQKRDRDFWTKVRYMPQAGRMLIFPSWLYHAVDPNLSTEEGEKSNRIIISFNLNQVRA